MKKEEVFTLRQVEDAHWWYLGHRYLFSALLEAYCPESLHGRVLDAGCGTGGFTQWFRDKYRPEIMAGIEISDDAFRLCEGRGLQGIKRSSIEDIDFPDSSFDLVISFNVLNHNAVKNDSVALSEMKRVLEPGGCLLLNLPARKSLRGRHDIAVGDVRRYETGGIKEKLVEAGLEPIRITYFNMMLLPVMATYRMITRMRPGKEIHSDLWLPPAPLNLILTLLLALEARIARRHDLPNGSSIAVLARRPEL
ncbi:MAG: hypothetical protein A2W01_12355 [Candidatus Solincola sediminis]|uniref:Methyltransferase type 11 domain-containing protein n=1 Tax=Candidatus Solincola sediminis TaxID=1797199 RepID=A0A1F2WRX4_9ACTN|nr:MAG: hypothetical protein A2Y75_01220 [Candidatus Solincola sediminis]OFW60956.1 MAG: hypothetical protein A2W01_12355 [Candidatus Solincola sediminis]